MTFTQRNALITELTVRLNIGITRSEISVTYLYTYGRLYLTGIPLHTGTDTSRRCSHTSVDIRAWRQRIHQRLFVGEKTTKLSDITAFRAFILLVKKYTERDSHPPISINVRFKALELTTP